MHERTRGLAGVGRLLLAAVLCPALSAVAPAGNALGSGARVRPPSGALACGAAVIGVGARHVPAGHYGRAPDELPAGYRYGAAVGHFPTRFRSINAPGRGTAGAFVVDDRQMWIGGPESKPPDRGAGAIRVECAPVPGAEPRIALAPARLVVPVSLRAGSGAGLVYLNALVDLDADGRWDGANGPREWVVRNCAAALRPGSMGVPVTCPWLNEATLRTLATRAAVGSPGRLYPLPAVWCRVLLTRAPLPRSLYGRHGWTGAGPEAGFPQGAVEDVLGGEVPAVQARPVKATASATPRPVATVAPTRTGSAGVAATATPPAILTPTPSTTASPSATATATPTQTPLAPQLDYVTASHEYDPVTGQVRFRLRLDPLAPQNQIYALQWLGAPWSQAQPGQAPPGWTWSQVAGGWQATTHAVPLFTGEIVYFGLTPPIGSAAPDTVGIVAGDAGGHPLGLIVSSNLHPATVTPTVTGTATASPSATATPLPVQGVVSFYHFAPTTGALVIDVQALDQRGAGQVYGVDLLGPPWSAAIPGPLSGGWHWQYVAGGQQATTLDQPIQPMTGLSLQLTLPPPLAPPNPLVLLALDRSGNPLGQIVSQAQ